MSCVVAFADLGGRPIERGLLSRLAGVPPYDPARAHVWNEGPVGVCGIALARRPSNLAIREHPDGSAIVVALDGFVGDRAALIASLAAAGMTETAAADDAGLVALAYAVWGCEVVQRLSGEFAFCLWDSRARTLVAARDHFGVKPLYLSRRGTALMIATATDSLRRAPGVSARLSDHAVGDFLLFGDPQAPDDTLFADIERVPPGHLVTWTPDAPIRVTRYWRLEAPSPLSAREARDAPALLRDALQRAVAERVADRRTGVLMSGGLDSTSVAALARTAAGGASRVKAVTAVYETAFEDRERRWSRVAADALGVDLVQHAVDRYGLFDGWDSGGVPPVPIVEPLSAIMSDLLARLSTHADVALAGDGGDPLLLPSTVPRHLGRAPVLDVVRGVWSLVWRYRRLPLFGLRTRLRRRAQADTAVVPAWFAPTLLQTYDPRARRREIEAETTLEGTRPEALQRTRATWWPSMFEGLHPVVTGQPVEIRYPFFDRRVVALGLALPSYPWCIDKIVLREAMAGILPEAVRLRPKTPLPVDSIAIRPRWTVEQATSVLAAAPGIERYIDVSRFAATVHPDRLLLDAEPGTLAAVSLAVWLTYAPTVHEASASDVRVASA